MDLCSEEFFKKRPKKVVNMVNLVWINCAKRQWGRLAEYRPKQGRDETVRNNNNRNKKAKSDGSGNQRRHSKHQTVRRKRADNKLAVHRVGTQEPQQRNQPSDISTWNKLTHKGCNWSKLTRWKQNKTTWNTTGKGVPGQQGLHSKIPSKDCLKQLSKEQSGERHWDGLRTWGEGSTDKGQQETWGSNPHSHQLAPPEDLGLVPTTDMAAHNHLWLQIRRI